jgi:hypothetical protein
MHNEISDYLRMIDDADNAHSPWRRRDYADGFVDILRDIFTDDELIELAQAKAEGRLVVLPCKEVYTKAGDTLYLIDGGEIIEVTHCGAEISPSGEIYVVVAAEDKIFPFRQPDPENDLDPTDWCTETKEVMLDDFGKTVFLTREAAEKALGGAEG